MIGRIKDILRLLLVGVMLLGLTTEVEARKVRVQGVVVDEAGMPINGLDITQEGDDPALGEIWVASTDISGTFIGMIENSKQIHITGGSGYDVMKSVGTDRNVKIVLTENDIKTQMIQAVSVKIPEITVPKKTKAKVVGDQLIIPMGVIVENAWFTKARRVIIAPHVKDVMATGKDSIIYLTPHVLDGEEYRLVDQRKFNFDSLSNPLAQYSQIQKHSTITKKDLEKKAQAEADAKAKAKERAAKIAQMVQDSIDKVESVKKAKIQAEADAKAKIEAKKQAELKADADAKAKIEAKLKAEADAKAAAEAKIQAKLEAKQKAKEEAEAKRKAIEDAKAATAAEKAAIEQAKNDEKARVKAEQEAQVAALNATKESMLSKKQSLADENEAAIAGINESTAAKIAQIKETSKSDIEAYIAKSESEARAEAQRQAAEIATEATTKAEGETKSKADELEEAEAKRVAAAKARLEAEVKRLDAEVKAKEEKAKAAAEKAKKDVASEPKKLKGDELVAEAKAVVKQAEEAVAEAKSDVASKESDVKKSMDKVDEATKALEADKDNKDLAAALKSAKGDVSSTDKALSKSESLLKVKTKELDKAKSKLKLAESTAQKEKERYATDVASKEKEQKSTKEVAEAKGGDSKVDKLAAEQARVDAQIAAEAERRAAEQARVDEAHAKTLTSIESQRAAAEERIYKKLLAEKMAAIKEMELKTKEEIAKVEADAESDIEKSKIALKESTGATEVEAQQKLADLKAAEKAKAEAEAQAKVEAAEQAKIQRELDMQFAQGERGLGDDVDQYLGSIDRESEEITKAKHSELMKLQAALQDTIKVHSRIEAKESAKLAAEADAKAKEEAKIKADEEKTKLQAEEKEKQEKERAAERERLAKRREDIKAGKKVNLANSFVFDFTDSVKIINNHGNFIIRINTVIEDYDRKLFSQVSEVAKGTIDPLRFFSYEIDGMPLRDSLLIPKPMMDQHADAGEAKISFRVNSTAIDDKDTVSRVELSKITDALSNLLNNPDAEVKKLSIHGVASPDGPYSKNSVLADKRSAFILDKVKAVVPREQMGLIKFEHSSSVEGWNTVADKIEKLDSLGKIEAEQIRDIIKKTSSPDRQWAMVRAMPRYKKIISPYILPALRRVEYKIEYSITRLRTVEEVLEVYNTGDPKERAKLFPIDLYNLMLAKKGDKDFREALQYILSVHPELSIVANELACLNISEGIFDLKVLEPYIKTITPRPIRYNQAINMLRNNMLEPAYKQIYRLPDTPEFEYIRMLVEAKYGEYAKVLPYFSKLGGLNEVLLLLADDRNVTAYQKIISLEHKDDDAIYFYVRALTEFRYSKEPSVDFMVSMNVEMEAVDNAMKAVKLDHKMGEMMKVDADMTGLLPLIEQKEKQMEEQQKIESNVTTK